MVPMHFYSVGGKSLHKRMFRRKLDWYSYVVMNGWYRAEVERDAGCEFLRRRPAHVKVTPSVSSFNACAATLGSMHAL